MLASPNAMDIMPKVGSRYEVALAVSKRARQIADKRIETGDTDITDPVDIAAKELEAGTVVVEKKETIQEAASELEEKSASIEE